MMNVDDRRARLGRYPVEQVAEDGHVPGAVLVARDDLIDGVDDDRRQPLVLHPPDQPGSQFVQRRRLAPQRPDRHLLRLLPVDAQPAEYLLEPGIEAVPVDFQVDVEHLSPPALPAQPFTARGDGSGQFHQQERLARLAGSRYEHLMSDAERPLDQFLRKGMWSVQGGVKVLDVREGVLRLRQPVLPCLP